MKAKNKGVKQKKTYQLVNDVLNPKKYIGNRENARRQALCNFIGQASYDDFEKAINIILRDDELYSILGQSRAETKDLMNKWYINYEDVTPERYIQWYKAVLLKNIDSIKVFLNLKEAVEERFVKGDYVGVNEKIDLMKSSLGESIWGINAQFAVYTANKEYAKIDAYLEGLKSENNVSWLNDIVRVSAWKSQAVDSELILESMVRRINKEFIAGDAKPIAAFYAITCLHFPQYDDVDLAYVICILQRFTLVDLFDSLIKVAQYGIAKKTLANNVRLELVNLFQELNYHLKLSNIEKIINGLKLIENSQSDLGLDEQVVAYNEGRYSDVIYSIENDIESVNGLISKVNIYAKSYIYLNKEPELLPDFLNEVVKNLISIYLLRDANQSISRLISLMIKYSSMEISDHLMISVVKAAPYYFSRLQKENLISKSRCINGQLTPLGNSLELHPSLFIDNSCFNLSEHLNYKKFLVDKIDNKECCLDLINDFYLSSKIKKDAIELKSEFLNLNKDMFGLIDYSSEELIANQNSNVCIPLDEIIEFIDKNNVYTVDSVICSYFHNLFSKEDNSSILNEVFEEYIVSLGVSRPSELINGNLSKKDLFVLKEVSKVEVMDYLGCFEDENDLKIERINLLNKLVDFKYLKQKDIDKECKYIVDDMLIESEAAKFNNSKIFVDSKHIFNKKKSDIDSLLIQYYSESHSSEEGYAGKYEIESMTVLKGSKNEIITRLINLLLLEFMNNQEVGLDANLSSEIRHGFFSNLMCSKLQHRHLITEINEDGNYNSNCYWMDYYRMVNYDIMSTIDTILMGFSREFNILIERVEQWMKTSINAEDAHDRVFVFQFTIEDFESIRKKIESYDFDLGFESENISEFIFQIFNTKLSQCLELIKHKLNEVFSVEVDELFSRLQDDINKNKLGTSLRDLLEEIRLANTEVKEDIRTVCEWFSFKKSMDFDSFESFDVKKSIKLAEKCFKQINNCNIDISVDSDISNMVEGKHLYAIVFVMINCFNNCYKYANDNKDIRVKVSNSGESGFSIKIINKIDSATDATLRNGRLDKIRDKLLNMDDNELLTNEGGTGLYKSLHALKMISARYNMNLSVFNNEFCVEVEYGN